jgi:cell division protein FtsL
MRDWVDGIETRNYGIKSKLDAGMLSELMRVIVAFVMVAGALLFYSWARSQIISTGYESQKLFAEEQSLLRTQKGLILEEEMLRSPERIDTIARNELQMMPLRPNQLILPQLDDAGISAPNAIAMVDSGTAIPRKAARTGAPETDRNN